LALLGGLLGLDGISCVQSMVARPIVAGPLAGLVIGDPVAGMWAGALLELVSLKQLPIGANRHWDTGPAAVAAAVAASTVSPAGTALVVGVGFGALVGWAGSWSIHAMRHLNAQVVASQVGRPMAPYELDFRHLVAMTIDFVRAVLLTLTAVLCVLVVTPHVGGAPQSAVTFSAVALLVAAAAALGVVIGTMARGRVVVIVFGFGVRISTVVTLWLR
jgi:mannose/fructose/N-acetylgalactosamine-specific phosphotransferase system component IIC